MSQKYDATTIGMERTLTTVATPPSFVQGAPPELRQLSVGDRLRNGTLHLRRKIGAGGMGLVFEAFDSERGELVAVKTTSYWDADRIYRFKNEFRSLSDFDHPNLCKLHELFCEDGHFYFTMELVHGKRFDHWVRPGGQLNELRLRNAISQLLDGLAWMHDAEKLHRDLKPSNVLVTEEGQVVILDFGLASENRAPAADRTTTEWHVWGTPSYMAPEQISAGLASPQSDLYAVGTMLFEALTGKKPFVGSTPQVIAAKLNGPAPRIEESKDVPKDLVELCAQLLAREQEGRPSINEILDIVATGESQRSGIRLRTHRARPSVPLRAVESLVGRSKELAMLDRALLDCSEGRPVTVFLSGEPGMGKTALVSAFLEDKSKGRNALVLTGGCNEREDVPFKAFDALVDGISRYLRKLPEAEASWLLPREAFALTRLFPVLGRVPAIARAPVRSVADDAELRRRAFDAFRELLARIGDRQPTCVFIDDIQWIDQDSVPLMRSLLVDREPAQILLILCQRTDRQENENLAAFRDVSRANTKMLVRELELDPLSKESSCALAITELTQDTPDRDALARTIADEANGSPLFVQALASNSTWLAQSDLSFDELLKLRLDALPTETRRMLEMAALLGQPLSLRALLAASNAGRASLDRLQAERLLRVRRQRAFIEVECYHHRIREAVTSRMSSAVRKDYYQLLSAALSASADADADLLTDCFEGAGQLSEGGDCAARAAERAEKAMAFERAARLYKRALRLGPSLGVDRKRILVSMAEALANSGRSKEAAHAFVLAAKPAQGTEATRLRRRAAFELLTGGYGKRGEKLMRAVCREVGISIPRTPRAAMMSYAMMQARLRFTALPRPEEDQPELSEETELRLEVAATTIGLGVDDPVLGLWAGSHYLLLAIEAKSKAHIGRALSVEGYNTTMLTPRSEERIGQLFARAEAYAEHLKDHGLAGVQGVYEGIGFVFGRKMTADRGRERLLLALDRLRGSRGNRFYVDTANLYLMLAPSTDFPSEARKATLLVEEAFSLKRMWTARHMASASVYVRLLAGDRDGIVQHLEQASAGWRAAPSMKWIDVTFFEALATLAFYEADPERTLEHADDFWPNYEGSLVQRSRIGIAAMHTLRGTAAVWVARRSDVPKDRRNALLKTARRDLKRVSKLDHHPLVNMSLSLAVGLALAQGDQEQAIGLLQRYIDRGQSSPVFGGTDLWVARRLGGQLRGGSAGDLEVETAERTLRQMGLRDLDACSRMLLPGCYVS